MNSPQCTNLLVDLKDLLLILLSSTKQILCSLPYPLWFFTRKELAINIKGISFFEQKGINGQNQRAITNLSVQPLPSVLKKKVLADYLKTFSKTSKISAPKHFFKILAPFNHLTPTTSKVIFNSWCAD